MHDSQNCRPLKHLSTEDRGIIPCSTVQKCVGGTTAMWPKMDEYQRQQKKPGTQEYIKHDPICTIFRTRLTDSMHTKVRTRVTLEGR